MQHRAARFWISFQEKALQLQQLDSKNYKFKRICPTLFSSYQISSTVQIFDSENLISRLKYSFQDLGTPSCHLDTFQSFCILATDFLTRNWRHWLSELLNCMGLAVPIERTLLCWVNFVKNVSEQMKLFKNNNLPGITYSFFTDILYLYFALVTWEMYTFIIKLLGWVQIKIKMKSLKLTLHFH